MIMKTGERKHEWVKINRTAGRRGRTESSNSTVREHSKRSWKKVRGGRGVMRSSGGTETNRARVKRRGAEKKRVKRMRVRAWQWQSERARECEWKADRKGMNPCGTQKETDTATSLTVRLDLSLSLSPSFSFSTSHLFFLPVSLYCSLLSFASLKPSPSAHFLLFFIFSVQPPLSNPHFLSLASTISPSPPPFLFLRVWEEYARTKLAKFEEPWFSLCLWH